MDEPTPTRRIAEFAANYPSGDIPDAMWQMGRLTIGNGLALAVGACRDPAVERTLAALTRMGQSASASIIGRSERIGTSGAALVNGIAMHVEDFDDTHLEALVHPAAPVVPGALAAAERVGASGRDLLVGVIVGMEVAIRLGLALGRSHADLGWHVTGTAGHVGSAAAAGRILGLNVDEMAVAIGVAATEAGGLVLSAGTMTKSLHPGKAAADGVQAACFAAAGVDGGAAGVDSVGSGYVDLASPAPDLASLTHGLGERWHGEDNAFKPYACGIVAHPVVECASVLRSLLGPGDGLEEVEVVVNPIVLDAMGRPEPVSRLDAKFSAYHGFAVGFDRGVAGPAEYEERVVRSPRVSELRRRVRFVVDESVPLDAARAFATTVGGRQVRVQVDHARGSASSPLEESDLRAKAHGLVSAALGGRTSRFLDLAFAVDTINEVSEVVAASRSDPKPVDRSDG